MLDVNASALAAVLAACALLGITEVHAGKSPEEKVAIVRQETAAARTATNRRSTRASAIKSVLIYFDFVPILGPGVGCVYRDDNVRFGQKRM